MWKGARVVLVENGGTLGEVRQHLSALGYDVVGSVGTDFEAVARTSDLRPDLVIVDLDRTDGRDGIAAAQRLLAVRQVPVVFVIDAPDPQLLDDAECARPSGYLLRPISSGELACVVEVALRRSADERAVVRRHDALTVSLDSATDGIVLTDPAGAITYMNRTAQILAARTLDESRGHSLDEALVLIDPETDRIVKWPLIEAHQERVPRSCGGPLALCRSAPDPLPVEVMVSPVFDEAGELAGGVGLFRDLRARLADDARVHHLEDQTRSLGERVDRSEQRFRALLENATDGVWILSLAGVVLDGNARVAEIHGQPVGDLIGKGIREILAEESMEKGLSAFERIFAEGFVRVDAVAIRRPDRERRLVDFSGCLVPMGDDVVVLALERDVTEALRLEEQNRQLQKLEAIGQLTGGVAHDFNNILGVILANSHFLLESLAPDDPRHADAEEIRSASERGVSLTRQLLAFSRKQVLEPTVLDLRSVVDGVGKMLHRVIGEDIELVITPGAVLSSVLADRGQIEQVLMNLVVNARDAMPSGGEVRIETANVELDEAYALGHPPLVAGRYVMLSVADTGHGMDPETRRRAFEPFFTTKERGRGTGLGLSTVYGIVKQSGGTIWLDSELGQGTVFKIYLPRHEEAVQSATGIIDVKRLDGSESVLLIEDDDAIRVAIMRVLAERGYRVQVARTWSEAMAASEDEAELDLVLSDMVIPGGSGPDAALEIAGRRGARLLFMSGYTDHVLLRSKPLPENVKFLQKPFTPGALLRKLREVLDAGPTVKGSPA